MNTTLPNAPAESTVVDEPEKADLPEDAIDKPLPKPTDEDGEPGESDELEPEEPVGTPDSNQRAS